MSVRPFVGHVRSFYEVGKRILIAHASGAIVATLIAVGTTGCSTGTDLPAIAGSSPEPSPSAPSVDSCTDGDTRACSITLGLHGGVLDCYEGTQSCTQGTWSACSDGTTVQHKAAPGARSQSLGPATGCTTNPCDPFCWNFANEAPVGGVQAGTDGSVYDWTAGGLSSLPPGLEKKGFQEPCESASDCQFNYHCTDVATSSTCSHSKCVAGSALSSTCDPCVTSICTANPTCCADTTCAHDFCQAGTKLSAGCDPCVASVCAARPSCCSGSWDATCVALVASTCAAGTCACPSGAFTSSGECYQAIATSQNWTSARGACQAIGSGWDLVSVSNATENAVVRSHVTATSWIGLNDRTTEGSFEWSNGDAVNYTDWISEPDNGGTGNEDCVDFIRSSGYWDDKPCTDTHPSLCEGRTNDPSATLCPSGTLENSGECYAFGTVAAKWNNAETTCQAYATGWHLATIDSAAENSFIAANLVAANSWVGYTDAASEGTWQWTGAPGSGYTNWIAEPNGGAAADCVRLDGTTGTWSDEACASTYNSICQGALGSSSPACAPDETANAATGTCYYVESVATDWTSADALCAARGPGWHLTSIGDAAEDTFVRGLLANGAYWIGLNDSASEGNPAWADTSVVWSGWHAVTNNANNRDCIKLDKATDGWSYNSCSPNGGLPYVCEGPKRRCFNGSVEYGGACYFVNTTNRTWAQAQTTCRARGTGWDLATPSSAAENAYVRSLTSSADDWIGLNDVTTEGSFVWSSGSTSSYRNWAMLAPTGGTSQNCAAIIKDAGNWDHGGWDDLGCNTACAYVCEGPKTAPPACDAGTTQSGTHCFALDATARTWSAARTSCQGRGSGWDLATITSAADNGFVQSLTTGTDTWIGLNDSATEGTFVWADGSAVGYAHWAPIEPNGGANADCVSLAVAPGSTSDAGWSDESCNNAHPAMCEGPKMATGATPRAWSQTCVNAVAAACGATCGTPATGTGVCAAWLPGETNPTCQLADLSAGVPCGNEIIPVCNHGTKTAPAGIPIVHFAANSQQYPKCAPDLNSSARKDKGECVTTQPIPPGQCIDVACPSLTQNNEIMVNPPGLPGSVPECSCQDNWSLYNKGATCDAPTCSGASSRANLKKVNLYFIFDRSGSMGDALAGGGTKWSGSVSAMTAFFQDANSAGIGIALEFFPLTANQTVNGVSTGDGCYSGSSCSTAPCGSPMVPLGTLSAQSAPADTQEDKLVKALSGLSPSGNTPSYPAMRGALDWAIAGEQADPTNEYAVVLVTDGDPTRCFQGGSADTTNDQIALDAAAAFNTYGVHTYAIGQEGANLTALDKIASSGGTTAAFVIGGANQTQVRTDLLDALHTIAGQSASCSFDLPNQGSFDPRNAKVTYTSGSGSPVDLAHQPDASGCGSGWYYDNNTKPTKVTFCPTTCGIVQADANAKIDVMLGCPAPVKETVYSQSYTATCPASQRPQWGYISYDSVIPGDSSVTFKVRVAATQAALSSATWTTVASTQTDPAVCGPGGPGACPKALYPLLGQYAAHYPYLELQIVLEPTSDKQFGPTVNSWNVSYSCPYSE